MNQFSVIIVAVGDDGMVAWIMPPDFERDLFSLVADMCDDPDIYDPISIARKRAGVAVQ